MPKVYLKELAFSRSGDKGDVSNVGVMAKTREVYEKVLLKEITEQKVREHFKGKVKGDIEIYKVDNLDSVEVIMRRALGGGATCTLGFDQTGKAMGPWFLRMEVEVDQGILDRARKADQEIINKYKTPTTWAK